MVENVPQVIKEALGQHIAGKSAEALTILNKAD